jgi:tetratricopeptide (TPR) repeat protein/uncharacterized protein YtpQ (UPF0354 family)
MSVAGWPMRIDLSWIRTPIRQLKLPLAATIFAIFAASAANAVDKATCHTGADIEKADACQRLITAGGLSNLELAKAYNNLGIGLVAIKSPDAALGAYAKALASLSTYGPAIANRAILYRDTGKFEQALMEFDRVIAINSQYVFGFVHRGITHKLKGDLDSAIKDFDRVLGLEPRNITAIVLRADAWSSKGDYNRALADYDRAQALAPTDARVATGRRQALASLAERTNSGPTKPTVSANNSKVATSIMTGSSVTAAALHAYLIPLLLKFPKVMAVSVTEERLLTIVLSEGEPFAMGLGNLLDGMNQDMAARPRLVTASLNMVEHSLASRVAEVQLTREQFIAALIPIIKNVSYVDHALKASVATGTSKPATILYWALAADIVVLVALDGPSAFQMMNRGGGLVHGISDQDLFDHAIRNLEKQVANVKVIEAGAVKLINFKADYNASLILIDAVWARLAPNAEADLVVAVPARDAVLFGSAANPSAIDALKRAAALPGQAYPITQKLLRRVKKGWVTYQP